MKNKLTFLFYSIKQSVVNKPIAFLLLLITFFAMTCCCSIPSRFAVSDFCDMYAKEASLNFDMKLNNFIKYRDEIFACCEKKEKELKAYNIMDWSISITQYNCDIRINGIDTKIDNMDVIFSKFKQLEIVDKVKICFIGEYDAKEYGIAEGDTLEIYGINFIVSKIDVGTSGFWLPYDIEIQNWYSFVSPPDPYTGKTMKSKVSGGVSGLSREDLNNLNWQLKKFGCRRHNTEIGSLASSFVVVLVMLAIGIVASTSILLYWLKCNNKKYVTYKTLGCSPIMLACTMIIETVIIALFAIGLGVLFDLILSAVMIEKISILGFEWLHYLMIICGPFMGILLLSIIAVIKHAIALPADSKNKI